MKTDLYTKVVLTVIAFFLALNVIIQIDFIPKAKASKNEEVEQTVRLPLYKDEPLRVNIVSIDGIPIDIFGNYKRKFMNPVTKVKEEVIVALPIRNIDK